jgi:hypothetical protein
MAFPFQFWIARNCTIRERSCKAKALPRQAGVPGMFESPLAEFIASRAPWLCLFGRSYPIAGSAVHTSKPQSLAGAFQCPAAFRDILSFGTGLEVET